MMPAKVPRDEIRRRIRAVMSAEGGPRASFTQLVKLAELDPSRDLRFSNLSGVDFRNQNLSGYDFTGCILHGCDFTNALIANAVFTQSELGQVTSQPSRQLTEPGKTTAIADLRRAADYGSLMGRQPRISRGRPVELNDANLNDRAIFQDAVFAPQMVVINMGDYRLAVSRELVKAREWLFFNREDLDDESEAYIKSYWDEVGDLAAPQGVISWNEIEKDYIARINKVLELGTERRYRLLNEFEWERCCLPSWRNGSAGASKHFLNACGILAIGNIWELCANSRQSPKSTVDRIKRNGWEDRLLLPEDQDDLSIENGREGEYVGFRIARVLRNG